MRSVDNFLLYEKYTSPCSGEKGCIYGYFEQDNLVYIGQTTQSVQKRYHQHAYTNPRIKPELIDGILWFEVPRPQLDLYETVLINAYHPRHNVSSGKSYPSNTDIGLLGSVISHYCNKELSELKSVPEVYFINPNDLYVDPMKMAAYKKFVEDEGCDSVSMLTGNLWVLNTDLGGSIQSVDCRFVSSVREMIKSHNELRGFHESNYIIPLDEVVDNVEDIYELGDEMDEFIRRGNFNIYGYNQRTKKLVLLFHKPWLPHCSRRRNHTYKYDIRTMTNNISC